MILMQRRILTSDQQRILIAEIVEVKHSFDHSFIPLLYIYNPIRYHGLDKVGDQFFHCIAGDS